MGLMKLCQSRPELADLGVVVSLGFADLGVVLGGVVVVAGFWMVEWVTEWRKRRKEK
uniref:Uncharacterized protein n=1 Tax=Fagus sylvatica TaxID=28930 RepID=A0A2N9H3T9_FAGSY